MKEGLYKIEFQTNNDAGTGVGYLKDGKFHGGDSIIYYVGAYSLDGQNFKGHVKTNAHSQQQGMSSVFGIDSVNIDLTGTVNDNVIQLEGRAAEAPNIPFRTKLTWICD